MKIKDIIPIYGITTANEKTYDNPWFILYQFLISSILLTIIISKTICFFVK